MRAYARERETAMRSPTGASPAPTRSDTASIDSARRETNGHSGWFPMALLLEPVSRIRLMDRTRGFGRALLEIAIGDADHAPTEICQCVTAGAIVLPSSAAGMPAVAIGLDRKHHLGIREVDHSDTTPTLANGMLADRRRESGSFDQACDPSFKNTPERRVAASLIEQSAQDTDPGPSAASKFGNAPAQPADRREPAPERVVECLLEDVGVNHTCEIDQSAGWCRDRDPVQPRDVHPWQQRGPVHGHAGDPNHATPSHGELNDLLCHTGELPKRSRRSMRDDGSSANREARRDERLPPRRWHAAQAVDTNMKGLPTVRDQPAPNETATRPGGGCLCAREDAVIARRDLGNALVYRFLVR